MLCIVVYSESETLAQECLGSAVETQMDGAAWPKIGLDAYCGAVLRHSAAYIWMSDYGHIL